MYVLRAIGERDKEHLSLYGENYGRDKGLLAEGWHLSGDLKDWKSLDESEGGTRHPSPS